MIEGFFSSKPENVQNGNGQTGLEILAWEDASSFQRSSVLKFPFLPPITRQSAFASGQGQVKVRNRKGDSLFQMSSEVQLPGRGWETRIAFGKEQLPPFSAQVLGQIPGATAVRLEGSQLGVTASQLTGLLEIANPPRLCQIDYQDGSGIFLAHSGHQGDWEVKVRSNGRKTIEVTNPPRVTQFSVPQGSQVFINRTGYQTYPKCTLAIAEL